MGRWRKARFSRASWRWTPQRNGKSRSRRSSVVIMERDSRRVRGEGQSLWPPDGVLAKDRISTILGESLVGVWPRDAPSHRAA